MTIKLQDFISRKTDNFDQMHPDRELCYRSGDREQGEVPAEYRHLAEFSQDGIIIADLDGRVLIANPSILAMVELGEIPSGRPLNVFDFIAPESMAEARRDFAGMRADRKGIVRTYRIVSAGGNCRHMEVLGNRITYQGRPANILSVRDITGRKEMEFSLRRSEERFRLLAENSPDIITSLSPDLTVDYISPAVETFLGYQPGDIIGCNALEIIHPEDRAFVEATARDVANGNEEVTLEYRVNLSDGRTVWFETTSRAVRNELTGELIELYNVSRDITKRKSAEEIAHRRDRVLHGFASASGFLLTGRLKDPLPRVLSTIGEAMGADVAYIYEDSLVATDGSHTAVRRYRWEKDIPGPDTGRTISSESEGYFPVEWSHRLASGVWISGCMNLCSGSDREVLEDLGIHSILIVPIFVSGAYWGFTGVTDFSTNRVWEDTEIEIFMMLAATLGLVFEKQVAGQEEKRGMGIRTG